MPAVSCHSGKNIKSLQWDPYHWGFWFTFYYGRCPTRESRQNNSFNCCQLMSGFVSFLLVSTPSYFKQVSQVIFNPKIFQCVFKRKCSLKLYHYHMHKNFLMSPLISPYIQSVFRFQLLHKLFFSLFDSGSKQGPYILLIMSLKSVSVLLLPSFLLPYLVDEKTWSFVLEDLFLVWILLLFNSGV